MCGEEFEGRYGSIHCPECLKKVKSNNKLVRKCIDCGKEFLGYPRSFRCDDCNKIHKKELKRIQNQKQQEGRTRKLGSIDFCVACGKKYIVKSGKQRYCPDCTETETKKNAAARTREWYKESGYNEIRQVDRSNSVVLLRCVICGKEFAPNGKSITCSKECSEKLQRLNTEEYAKEHRKELRKKQLERYRKKIESMDERELKEYREKENERARENYCKKLEKSQDSKNNKICKVCGKRLEDNEMENYCQECLERAKQNHMTIKPCIDCGKEYVGRVNSLRCPTCKEIRKKELYRINNYKAYHGGAKKNGTIDYCVICGKEFIRKSGAQKYCPDCIAISTNKNSNAHITDDGRRVKNCVICGKEFAPHGRAKTCSKECSENLKKLTSRKSSNKYKQKLLQEKLDAMTDEERIEYFEKKNEPKIKKERPKYIKKTMDENYIGIRGLPAIGYCRTENDLFKPHQPESSMINEIFKEYEKCKSLSTLADICNERGYKTAYGKNFSKQSLKIILENPVYTGYGKCGKEYKLTHEAIVSQELFDSVQSILHRKQK